MHFCHNIVRLKRHYVKIRHLVYTYINAKDSLNTVFIHKANILFCNKAHIKDVF